MSNAEPTVPYGYCHCGCGELAPIATATDRKNGRVEGEPCRYLRGHNGRMPMPVPSPRECACGCGLQTPIAKRSNAEKSHVRGLRVPFCRGHRRGFQIADTYVVNEATGCWEWMAGRTNNGYGKIKRHGQTLLAHRVSYEEAFGPVPEGLELDHLCINRPCVNPAHLEAVTHAENMRRRQWIPSLGVFPAPRKVPT